MADEPKTKKTRIVSTRKPKAEADEEARIKALREQAEQALQDYMSL